MVKVKVRLLKALNGEEIGSQAEYDERDAARLVGLGAVELVEGNTSAAPRRKKKAPAAPKNKMQPPPSNKADGAESSPSGDGEVPAKPGEQG